MLDGHLPQESPGLNSGIPNFHRVTMHEIALEVCERYGVTLADLKGPRRLRLLSAARQEFMALAYELPHASLPVIGRFLDRDHTTILHGVRRHRKTLHKE